MMIQFRPVTSRIAPHRMSGDYWVFRDSVQIGTLRWGTGTKAGWYFIAHDASEDIDAGAGASGIKVCDLEIDTERVKAQCHDGVLTLFLPRAEQDKPRSIKLT